MKVLTYLRSNQFAIMIAILSVLVQSFHSFTAFYNTSALKDGWGIAQAILFAVVIDLAILFYTVRGRRDIALYAAVAMVTINAYYYYQHLGITFEFIFGCFLSLIIPVSVYFYSEEIKEDEGPSAAGKLIEKLEREKRVLLERNEVLSDELDEVKTSLRNWKGEAETWEQRYNEAIQHVVKDRSLINVSDPPELDPDRVDYEDTPAGKREINQPPPIRISRTGGDKNDKA